MSLQTIHAILFSAATSLNAFWLLNVAKEASPAVKEFFNFYPVTGPLLGLYIASIIALVASFAAVRSLHVTRAGAFMKFSGWYFVLSVIIFFFAVFPPVYEPVVGWLASF